MSTSADQVYLPAVFPVNVNASASLATSTQPLLGSILLKQWRVSNQSCTLTSPAGQTLPFLACYGPYSFSNRDTSNYSTFSFQASNSPAVYGQLARYDEGGYVQTLNSSWTLTQAMAFLQDLQTNQWLGIETRALGVFFNLGNTNLGWAVPVQVLIEVGITGIVLSSITTTPVPLTMYAVFSNYEALLIVGDIVLALYALALTWTWVVWPVWSRQTSLAKNLTTVWNLLALCLFALVTAQIVCCIVYEFSTRYDVSPSSWAQPGGAYNSLGLLQGLFLAILGLSAVNLLLVISSALRFTQSDLFASRIWQSIHRASRHLAGAILIFAVALASMALWAYIAWGSRLFQWSDAARATANLVSVMFGSDLNFAVLRQANNTLFFVVVFFLIWFLLVVLVLLPLLGSVILDAYFEVATVLPLKEDDSLVAMLSQGMREWRQGWKVKNI